MAVRRETMMFEALMAGFIALVLLSHIADWWHGRAEGDDDA